MDRVGGKFVKIGGYLASVSTSSVSTRHCLADTRQPKPPIATQDTLPIKERLSSVLLKFAQKVVCTR